LIKWRLTPQGRPKDFVELSAELAADEEIWPTLARERLPMSRQFDFYERAYLRNWITEAELRRLGLQLKQTRNGRSNLAWRYHLNKVLKTNWRYPESLFDVSNGQQRAKHVEILLQPHLIFEQVLAGIATRHMAVVITKSCRIHALRR